MDQITAFDDWIRRRRKALDLTQAQLAARVGCAVVTIKKIEQATRRPSQQMAELLADALAIPEAERALFLRMARHEYVAPSVLPTIIQDAAPDADAAPAAAFLEWRRPSPFVGRAHEMAQLDTHLTGARNGSGRIVFISGEVGRGKTTLMTEFARHALATYPDLKANQNMAQLTEELTATENKVAFARQAYNDAVTTYNTYKQSFPNNVFAGMFGHQQDAALLEFDSQQIAEAPKVQF